MAWIKLAARVGGWTAGLALLAVTAVQTPVVAPARAQSAQPSCPVDRPIVFAGFDWNSARFHNALARYLVETVHGCETDDIPGSTIPLLSGLVRGDVDIAMEVWLDRATKVWEDGVRRGKVASVGLNMADATQSWYVPRYMIEGDEKRGIEPSAPELASVFDLPRYAELFTDPERPRLGRFYNCSLGWQCEVNNTKKIQAYGLDASFSNFRVGTGAALAAAIASAYQRGEPFLAYYWDPSWITARFDLVALEEPPYDAAGWDIFAAERRPEEAMAYPAIEQHVAVNTQFQAEAGALLTFLSAYQTNKALMRAVLLHMYENRGLEDGALVAWFLETYPDVWRGWLTAEQIEIVEADLARGGPARD